MAFRSITTQSFDELKNLSINEGFEKMGSIDIPVKKVTDAQKTAIWLKNSNFIVRNIIGQLVFQGTVNNMSNRTIDLSDFESGVYTIEFGSKENSYTQKLVIEQKSKCLIKKSTASAVLFYFYKVEFLDALIEYNDDKLYSYFYMNKYLKITQILY